MPIWQVLAIVVAMVEIVGGLLIAFNVLARTAAVVLLIFTAVTTFYYHDFWNMAGAERTNNLILALKNLSIIGALLMLAAWPRRVVVEPSGERMETLDVAVRPQSSLMNHRRHDGWLDCRCWLRRSC